MLGGYIMNKKGMALWEIVIWAIILLVVAAVVLFIFQKLFGSESEVVGDEIAALRTDTDKDGIIDKFDKCKDTPRDSDVDARGCAPGQKPA